MKFIDSDKTKRVTCGGHLSARDMFVYCYGAFNCRRLKMKSYDEVIESLKTHDLYDEISEKQVAFIRKSAGKLLLCHISHIHENNPDVFVYGDNNIPFGLECFDI